MIQLHQLSSLHGNTNLIKHAELIKTIKISEAIIALNSILNEKKIPLNSRIYIENLCNNSLINITEEEIENLTEN